MSKNTPHCTAELTGKSTTGRPLSDMSNPACSNRLRPSNVLFIQGLRLTSKGSDRDGDVAPLVSAWPQSIVLQEQRQLPGSRLVHDSCQNNQFNRCKMWKCIDSITMKRYNLNISINSTMLLSTYEPTQSTQKDISNESIKSINQYTYC